jgi:hypothetical protein
MILETVVHICQVLVMQLNHLSNKNLKKEKGPISVSINALISIAFILQNYKIPTLPALVSQ